MLAGAPFRCTDLATWPWMFYLWAVFALVGLTKPAWSWLQRKRAAGWPVAEGRTESVEITKPSFSFTTKQGYYIAKLANTQHDRRVHHRQPPPTTLSNASHTLFFRLDTETPMPAVATTVVARVES